METCQSVMTDPQLRAAVVAFVVLGMLAVTMLAAFLTWLMVR